MRSLRPGTLIFSVLVTLGGGIFTMWFVWDYLDVYESTCSAPLAAPLWLMVTLWMGFYLLLGAGAAFMLDGRLPHADHGSAVGHWLILPVLSFLSAAVFFRLESLRIAFALTALTLSLCFSAMILFARASRPAGLCLAPCVLWQLYLCYLGFAAAAGI